jgi:hemerythrin-like domain-containing protein
MKPSDILKSEHRVIEQVLDCLEQLAQHSANAGQCDVRSAEQAIDFFRNFADRCHHGKEEEHFFPAMEAKGFSRDCGPTGVMLLEHELGRREVTGMSSALAACQAGDGAAPQRFAEHARAYIRLLREHIQKEDHCLFSMADQAFTPADQQQLLTAFEHVEAEHMGAGTHEKYLQLANELADRLGVVRAEPATAGCHGCCGH